jgi:tRNA threonylcarbamoyladenosine biosynthesis protein TsaE
MVRVEEWTTLLSPSATETEALGQGLAGLLRPGTVLPLYGNLGSGKTVLSRGIARGLGISEPVTSPTFTVVQEYLCPSGLWFYHLDMYRIGNTEDALAFGIDDFLFAPQAITVVEWPERIESLLETPWGPAAGTALVPVYLEHAGPEQRKLRLPARLGLAKKG